MRCILCKSTSDDSVSSEHILPESLGNKEILLPPGVVCDNCNNYLSHKVEKPILEAGMFRFIRRERRVVSKKGKLPIFEDTEKTKRPSYRIMGRFIGKIGLECLAEKLSDVTGWNDEIVHKAELDELREFVRFNSGDEWPFTFRTLYPVNSIFKDGQKVFEVLNEFDLLYTEGREIYVVLVLFGVEFAMNLGGRVLDGYRKWLEQHNWASPLYVGKNKSNSRNYYIE